MTRDIAAAKAALSHLDLDDRPTSLRAASRDFFWYSPILKSELDDVIADFVVRPKSEAEVIEVLATCFAHDVPVTARGAGTGNYGQAMPLDGGCVLHLRHMDQIKSIEPGRVTCGPGVLLKDLDAACIADSGQELRMFPSTWATATVGGFIAGGSGGVGSCTWGFLADPGNILRLRMVTMEASPRVIELTGSDLAAATHAYGTTGIVTEIEMPLAPAYEWVDLFMTFEAFSDALQCAEELGNADGILLKLATLFEAPIAQNYFPRVQNVDPGQTLMAVMVAPQSLDALLQICGGRGGAKVIYCSRDHDWDRPPGRIFEYCWNHTTLRALKTDPDITYLQVRYAYPDHQALIHEMRARFHPEVMQHVELIRSAGKMQFSGLSLVKFTDEARLEEIIAAHDDAGALVYTPHRHTLEEGGRYQDYPAQLDMKRRADPKGLLNPGKMIAWHDPDWSFEGKYIYQRKERGR